MKLNQCICGSPASLMRFGQSWIVECSTCSLNSGSFSTPELAVSRWNKMISATNGNIEVRVKRIRENAQLPRRAHPSDLGLDIYAADIIRHGDLIEVLTGLQIELGGMPVYGYQLRPRSSIYKTGWILTNSFGTVEATYRGELKAFFRDLGKPDIEDAVDGYQVGDRICQLCFPETINPTKILVMEVDKLSESERGEGGFGSTGNA